MHKIRSTAAWVLAAERAPQAPQAGYEVECVNCGARSGHVPDESTPVELWAIRHTAQHGLLHSQFAQTTLAYWAVVPRDGRAYGDVWRDGQRTGVAGRSPDAHKPQPQPQPQPSRPQPATPPRPARAHARRRRRGSGLRRLRAVIRR